MLSARKEAGKFSEGVILSKSMEVLFRAVPPSLYLAMAMTEPEEKAERFQLMQQHGISELDAAFRVAEKIDRARGIERSEEHTSELQSLMRISYAVFCLKKQKKPTKTNTYQN